MMEKEKKLGLNNIKKQMLEWHDLFGGDMADSDAIKNAKTKSELAAILHNHRNFLEDSLIDAQCHLDRFKESLGLHMY